MLQQLEHKFLSMNRDWIIPVCNNEFNDESKKYKRPKRCKKT